MLAGLTIRGRCLLAAGVAAAVCSLVLDERDLLRIAAFVTALPLLALLVTGRSKFGLAARREIVPTRVPVGSEAAARVHVSGHARLPMGGLLLEDGVPHALGGRPRFFLDRLPRRDGLVLEYSVQPALRGVHQIGPLRTRISDPFGLAEFEHELAGRSRVVAVPRVVPLGGLPAGSGLGIGEDGSTRLRAGHGNDDVMVREYRHGDDMRRVHWKSTARRDELMVRVEERPWRGGVTVLLDRRSAAHRGSGAKSSLEWAVSAAGSICLHLHHNGQQARLRTEDGHVLAGGMYLPDSGHDDNAVLDSLAAVQPTAQRDLACGADPGGGQELIAILGATTTTGIAELTKLRPQGVRSLALLLDVRAWTNDSDSGFDPHETAHRLRSSGWTVALVDGPRTSVAAVWGQLCRASTAVHGAGAAG